MRNTYNYFTRIFSFFPCIIFVFGLLAGFILKLLVIYLLGRIKPESSFRSVSMRIAFVYTLVLCIALISIAALIANRNIDSYNKKIEPRILLENMSVKKDSIITISELEINNWKFIDNKTVNYNSQFLNLKNSKIKLRGELKESIWNGQKVYLCCDDSYAYILSEVSENAFDIIVKQKTPFTYVSKIQGFETEYNGKNYFVLLTVLRPTLGRSVITIYSPEKEIMYQELTDRIRIINPVEINNKKYLITGNERVPEYVYSWE